MLTSLVLLQNIWVKAFICLASSYLIGFFSIKKYISFITTKGFFQPIRSDGPESHVHTKKKTPTMGGIFIVLATLISTFLFLDLSNSYIWIVCFVFVAFALIGLTDDLMKVIYKNPNGFRGSIKLVIQFMIIGAAFVWLGSVDAIHFKNRVYLPIGSGHWISLGIVLYILFVTFVIVGTSNAVNLTDGLDGLVSIPAIINAICLGILILIATNPDPNRNFFVPNIENSQELVYFCITLIGAILAFLTFNLKPAKVFMGDVGSLAIGSALGVIAIIIKQEFIFFVISILFVAEAVSVILQVGSYKLRKKRIFLMAPLHHHFEKKGWSEQKVVRAFWSASALFAMLGMAIFLV
ncbi:MAG: phospho-N-acetylmuramoyl-pentapeptide-transferase [Pseudomonadota bacterium]